MTACSTDAEPDEQVGWFDRSDPRNPFQNYTVVHVLYCSGDVHGGNVTRPYDDRDGVPVEQRGYQNARAAVDWAKANLMGSGLTGGNATTSSSSSSSERLSSLVIGGCSAGSIGTQVWAAALLQEFEYDMAAVVADSYVGVFPPGTEGPLIASFGFCSTPLLLDEELQAVCAAGDITLQDMVHDAMGRYPSVLFSHVNSKFDVVQREYYAGVAATSLERPLYISKAAYTDAMNVLLKGYSERHANYVSFVVTASQHCYTP